MKKLALLILAFMASGSLSAMHLDDVPAIPSGPLPSSYGATQQGLSSATQQALSVARQQGSAQRELQNEFNKLKRNYGLSGTLTYSGALNAHARFKALAQRAEQIGADTLKRNAERMAQDAAEKAASLPQPVITSPEGSPGYW